MSNTTEPAPSARDVLLHILADADRPMKRTEILDHPDWGHLYRSTLTRVIRAAEQAQPSLVHEVEHGWYELTDDGRSSTATTLAT